MLHLPHPEQAFHSQNGQTFEGVAGRVGPLVQHGARTENEEDHTTGPHIRQLTVDGRSLTLLIDLGSHVAQFASSLGQGFQEAMGLSKINQFDVLVFIQQDVLE